ncbi:uncharacterized protein TNCV_734401 [Trichonephila clavipes]|nr:uncharacterized protein TNCV_734401 [Trichonephila clavipes]
MPTQEEKWLEFSNHKFKLPVPYVIYADLECILEKISSCEQDPKISSTEFIAKHVPCGFAYVIVGPDGTMVKPPTVFRGKNAIDQFLTKLLKEEKSILDTLRFVNICENPLNGDAVRDHDHLTGAYRGAAHNRCNLNFKLANYIPVLIHNLRNYAGHLLIQGIDANNLYGWAMSQHLPTHDFSWTDEDVNFMIVPDDSETGYIFEVDLEYPDELHDLHNCYPLAPETIEVSVSECSPYTKNIAKKNSVF